MHRGAPFLLGSILLVGVFAAWPAIAEKGDREKPIYFVAGHQDGNVRDGKVTLSGTVSIIQGSFRLSAARAIATEDAEGFHRFVATGGHKGFVRFRQKKNHSDEYMEGTAERVEYDERSTRLKLLGRASIRDTLNSASGEYIEYDDYNQTYSVDNAQPGKAAKGMSTTIFKPRPKAERAAQSAPSGQAETSPSLPP